MEIQIEDLQNLAKKLPEVTEDIKWENHLCMCIDDKMFFVMDDLNGRGNLGDLQSLAHGWIGSECRSPTSPLPFK